MKTTLLIMALIVLGILFVASIAALPFMIYQKWFKNKSEE